jgi:two-component system response regulator YesN
MIANSSNMGESNMDKLIIVDDEYSTRNGLKVCMEWEKYGIQVVGEADNGRKGLELAELIQPDIVITDVKMPIMDGIEMAKQLKARNRDVKIVFVSGYDDIEYLKNAMKMDAIDYILKPVNLAELSDVIVKIMTMSQKEKSQKDLLYRMNAKLHQSMPLLREKFLIQLIRDSHWDRSALEKRVEFLDLELPYQSLYCSLIISIDNPRTVFESISEKETELISFSILNICQELIDVSLTGYVIEHVRGEFVLIIALPANDGVEAIYPVVTELKSSLSGFLRRFITISMTIGIGSVVERLSELSESYVMALEAIEQKLYLGKDQIITFDMMASNKSIDFRSINEKVEALLSLLKTANTGIIFRHVDELFEDLVSNRGFNHKDCQRICMQVLLNIAQFLSEFGIRSDLLSQQESEVWEHISKIETLDDMSRGLKSYIAVVCASVEERKEKKTSEVVQDIILIVEEGYSSNLMIADIASKVYLSQTYICLLFKQETGMTINEYITKVRMEKSKELLTKTNVKLADICFSIGYTEPSYFSKQFRKYAGMNPSEYRELYQGGLE